MEPERGFKPTNHPITSSRVGVPTEQRLSHYIRSCRPCKPVGGGQTSPRVPIRPISPASNRGSSDGLLPVSSGATPRNDAFDHRTGSGWRPRTTPSGISSPSWTGSWRRSHPPSPGGHRDRPAFHLAGAFPQGQSAHRLFAVHWVPAEGGCSSVSGSSMTLRLRSGQALLFKWFLDLNVIGPAFDARPSPTTKSGCIGTRRPGSSSTG